MPGDPSAENLLGPYWTAPTERHRRTQGVPAAGTAATPAGQPPRGGNPTPRSARRPNRPPHAKNSAAPAPTIVQYVTQHLHFGGCACLPVATAQQLPTPAMGGCLIGSSASPSKWRHGPSARTLAAVSAADAAAAVPLRSLLSIPPVTHDPHVAAVAAAPADRPDPFDSPARADARCAHRCSALPAAGSSSPALSLADTPPPGTSATPAHLADSPPTFHSARKRRHLGDSIPLTNLAAIATAYSPARASAAAADKAAAAAHTAALATVAHIQAKAALLESSGHTAKAQRLRASAPPVPPAPNLPVAGRLPPASSSLAVTTASSPAVFGSLAADPPPPTSAIAMSSPDLDFTYGLDLLPPGEQRARLAAINAAADFVRLLEMWQAAKILGQPLADVRAADPRVVTADLVRVFGHGWSAGTIKSAEREWRNLYSWAYMPSASGVRRVVPGREIPGSVVRKFLDARHDAAVRKSKAKFAKLGKAPPRGHAGGHAAKGSLVTTIKWLRNRAHFRIDIASTAIQRAMEGARRSGGTPAPSLSPRNAFCLS